MDDEQGDPEWDAPSHLTIPFPLQMNYARGVRAKKEDGPMLHIRLTKHDKELILAEAKAAGMKSAMFGRWVVVQAAREARRIRTGDVVKVDL